ncbi:MAG: hypothetical protein ACREIA_03835 [Opitutaceae bacterium]
MPPEIRQLAREKYRFWSRNPFHPSLHFKRVGEYWSVRINDAYRAVGREHEGTVYWLWIGPHDEYERVIRR